MPQDSQIAEVTYVMSKAFKDFNTSVGVASEVVDEEFGDEEIGPVVLHGWVHTTAVVVVVPGSSSLFFVKLHEVILLCTPANTVGRTARLSRSLVSLFFANMHVRA